MPEGRCNRHGCPKCYTRPKTNRAFWDRKGETNTARDKRVNRQLRRQGWKVIRIWQLPSAVYATLRYQLIAKATYLAKPRYQLIATATYLAKPRFSTPFPK